MDLMILKKRIDGFRLGNGQLQKLPPELLFELRQAWEQFTGPAEEFGKEGPGQDYCDFCCIIS